MRRYPFLVIAAMFGVLAALFIFYRQIQSTPITMRKKLADFTTALSEAEFIAPKGKLFNLVMGVPGGLPSNAFVGEIVLQSKRGDSQTASVTRAELVNCNWLADEGIPDAYILTWSGDQGRKTIFHPWGETQNNVAIHAHTADEQFALGDVDRVIP